MSEHTKTLASRRQFLRDSLTLGAGATAAAVGASATAAVPTADPQGEKNQPGTKQGYRMTRHVADYYKTAGF